MQKPPPPPKGVAVGILGGQKNQKSGKCHELSRQKIKKIHELPRKSINIPPPVGILGGQKNKSPGNVMNGREKSLKKFPVSATHQNGCVFFASCKHCAYIGPKLNSYNTILNLLFHFYLLPPVHVTGNQLVPNNCF